MPGGSCGPSLVAPPRGRASRIGRLAAAAAAACALAASGLLATRGDGGPRTARRRRTAAAPAAHALVGYLHASFANGSGYTRIADVPDSWDIINLAFGEPTSATSGDIRFSLCPASECPNVESEADFKAAIQAKQAAGKKVLISIGGANGQVQLTTTAARDNFVSSVCAIIDSTASTAWTSTSRATRCR